jgi:predicted kinase
MLEPTLHFLCGKMAAGKSTLSKHLAKQHNAVLICEDIWLQQLFPVEITTFDDYLKYSRRLKVVVAPHVKELLCKGVSVVLDFPANVPVARAWVRDIFESANVAHVLHFVDAPNERCLEQLRKRNREKPAGSMEMSEEQFNYITSLFVPPDPSERFIVQAYR